jgi:hypothetical protein
MKYLQPFTAGMLMACFVAAPLSVFGADKPQEKKTKPYPLNTCVVSGEKLGGDHGEAVVFVHKGQEVKLCCKDCRGDFDKETAKFMGKIEEANKKVKAYPLNTCVVSGEKLGGDMGEPFAFVHDSQEIKLCCKDCKKDFDKEPAKYLKKVASADKKTKK